MSAKIQTSLRIDADKLAEAKQISIQLGMNFSVAVNIFTNLIFAKQGLLFEVVLPNSIYVGCSSKKEFRSCNIRTTPA